MKFFNNSKDAEEEANDYMCIRYRRDPRESSSCSASSSTSFIPNVWVGHAVALYVNVDETGEVTLKFGIQRCHAPPPTDLLSAGRMGKPCSIEFLAKTLPDRYRI